MIDARSDFEGEPDLERLRNAHKALGVAPKQAVMELEALAIAGSKNSMGYLARAYETGISGSVDLELAEAWYRRGFDAGSLSSLMGLAYLYIRSARFASAEETLKAGVDREYSLAIYILGRHYVFGPDRRTNRKEGLALLRRAGEMGNFYAMRDLGYLLIRGEKGLPSRSFGIYLYVYGLVKGLLTVWREPDSPRARMYGIY